jgi:subtilisin family serine protease
MSAVNDAIASVTQSTAVVIVDSGIPYGYPGSGGPDRDDDGHAAMVAETIRPRSAPGKRNIDLRFCKAFGAQGWPEPERCAAAIARAADAIAQATPSRPCVIVLPWDVGHATPALRASIEAVAATAVVVIAAGNWSLDNDKHPNWPANYGDMAHVITVMAADEHDERASYSSYGRERVYVAAPGVARVDAALLGNLPAHGSFRACQRVFRGTSAATAHVARLVALVLAKNASITPAQVKQHIRETARPVTVLKRIDRDRLPVRLCVTERVADFARALA